MKTFSRKEYMACLFIDIKTAYDSVNIYKLYTIILEAGVAASIAYIIYKMFHKNALYVAFYGQVVGPKVSSVVKSYLRYLEPSALFNLY